MKYQYTFACWPNERHKASAIYRSNEYFLERLNWHKDGTFSWQIVRRLPVKI